VSIKQHLIGDTIQVTMINSGVSPSAVQANVYDETETLVGSGAMVSSGNGHYYYDFTIPDTASFYVAETLATINGKPYKNRKRFQAIKSEV